MNTYYDSDLDSDLDLKITMKKKYFLKWHEQKNTQFRPKQIRHGKVGTISFIPVKKGSDEAEQKYLNPE